MAEEEDVRHIYTAYTKATGLNNRVDKFRLQYNPDTGITDLSEAINIDIDETGEISRRSGKIRISSVDSSTVFCDQGDCFAVVKGITHASIYQVGTDFSVTAVVVTGLIRDERIGFCQSGAKTYWSNKYQRGMIINGTNYEWPSAAHAGLETERVYSSAPYGSHIAVFDGHMLIAEGPNIWISEKYEHGKYRLKSNYFRMGTDIRLVKPVLNGIWVSDSEKTGFVPVDKYITQANFIKRASVPAHEWSENIELVDLEDTILQISGKSAIWSSDEGVCIGTEDGRLIVSTEDKLRYLIGTTGTSVVLDKVLINSVW